VVDDLAHRLVDHHERLPGTHEVRGKHGPVQDQVRLAGQQDLVLGARRLPLGAVGDDHRGVPARRDGA